MLLPEIVASFHLGCYTARIPASIRYIIKCRNEKILYISIGLYMSILACRM